MSLAQSLVIYKTQGETCLIPNFNGKLNFTYCFFLCEALVASKFTCSHTLFGWNSTCWELWEPIEKLKNSRGTPWNLLGTWWNCFSIYIYNIPFYKKHFPFFCEKQKYRHVSTNKQVAMIQKNFNKFLLS